MIGSDVENPMGEAAVDHQMFNLSTPHFCPPGRHLFEQHGGEGDAGCIRLSSRRVEFPRKRMRALRHLDGNRR
jgi:hypothetical protein